MKKFTKLKALVAPLKRANVDTDAVIPKQYLKSIKRTGYGPYLFDEWRYLDEGELGMDCSKRPLNPEFELNQKRFQGAGILLTQQNFGCGSSREHAIWSILEYGFHAIIAPSFADIFYNNCFKNGLLPITLDEAIVTQLFDETYANEGYELEIDLEIQQVLTPSGQTIPFSIDASRKDALLNGLDEIDITLQHADEIRGYEKKRRQQTPWLFDERK